MCESQVIFHKNHPKLFLIRFTTNYSKNYSGILYACLVTADIFMVDHKTLVVTTNSLTVPKQQVEKVLIVFSH